MCIYSKDKFLNKSYKSVNFKLHMLMGQYPKVLGDEASCCFLN